MNPETRILVWRNGVLKFPCGIEVKIDEKKLKWIFEIFKQKAAGNQLITKGQTTIPQPIAFQIRNYLIN